MQSNFKATFLSYTQHDFNDTVSFKKGSYRFTCKDFHVFNI
ncbi:hypothetical protein Sdiek1_0822 [Sulfurospirillum diekertiae]|uniref:Uncharacterized protein n=1 Tax=Sulfurospirillum diekertiae TaxID=1854492 RepID=A0A1Y0HIR3_9BACT|nr:hypothetical protein Sdiek1_0822 [Sulfurospirillum diekertiae]ASC92836.1 hypothetical protein Sdiek2_0814 [Sulfurospirillum diekertiae]